MKAENRSTHAAAFCDLAGRILLLREDIGRHNAVDKPGGALARGGRDARDGFILLSSRISVEPVQKAAVLGETGSAAWRERECQHASSAVVAESSKKKNTT